jgi:hypothetical protein
MSGGIDGLFSAGSTVVVPVVTVVVVVGEPAAGTFAGTEVDAGAAAGAALAAFVAVAGAAATVVAGAFAETTAPAASDSLAARRKLLFTQPSDVSGSRTL